MRALQIVPAFNGPPQLPLEMVVMSCLHEPLQSLGMGPLMVLFLIEFQDLEPVVMKEQ